MDNSVLANIETPSVIVLDDEESALQWLRHTLSTHGATNFQMATDFREFIELLKQADFDVASVDWSIAGFDKGPEIISYLRREYPDVGIVVYSAHRDKVTFAKEMGADLILVKRPDDADAYWSAITQASRLGLARRTARRLRDLGETNLPDLSPGVNLNYAMEARLYRSALKNLTADEFGTSIREYESQMPVITEFTQRVADLIERILEGHGIKYHVIQKRTKDLSSFRKKLVRKGSKYKDPIREMTDLSGVRVVAYYLRDVHSIVGLLRREFQIDEANSIDKATELPVTGFGYRSVHLIASLNDRRTALPEWKKFTALRSEIQVRTVLEHVWAAVSHELQYKREDEVVPVFKRRLARLSGLLELSDEEFGDLRREMEEFESEKTRAPKLPTDEP
jgi:ppGpp synthetase/RelA/SpoT-type nucleotidyltranferase/ActR/RegA family two-component response regulator